MIAGGLLGILETAAGIYVSTAGKDAVTYLLLVLIVIVMDGRGNGACGAAGHTEHERDRAVVGQPPEGAERGEAQGDRPGARRDQSQAEIHLLVPTGQSVRERCDLDAVALLDPAVERPGHVSLVDDRDRHRHPLTERESGERVGGPRDVDARLGVDRDEQSGGDRRRVMRTGAVGTAVHRVAHVPSRLSATRWA